MQESSNHALPRRRWALPLIFILAAFGVVLAVIAFHDKGKDPLSTGSRASEQATTAAKPPRRFPGAPRDSVKAQDFSRVDFKNPHTVKNVPRMMKTLTRREKLVMISKLKEVGTPEAVGALKHIVLNPVEMNPPERDLRAHAVGALISMDTDESWGAVIRLSENPDEQIRAWVASSLGYSESEKAEELLNLLCRDGSAKVVKEAEAAVFRRKKSKEGK